MVNLSPFLAALPMAHFLLNTIALDPNRWTPEKRPYFTLSQLLPDLLDAGFHSLEVWQYHISTLDDAAFDRLSARARSLGAALPIVGAYPILDLDDPEREHEQAEVEQLFSRAATVGASVVKFFAGRYGSASVDDEAYARSIDFTRWMAELAADWDLALTVETHPDTLCDSVEATKRFLADVDADHLGVCFQPYDFGDTEQMLADYRFLRRHVRHVHLQGRRREHMCLLENADIDYRAFLRELAKQNFDGYVCLEFVQDCVVRSPEAFDLDRVLHNAQRDRAFLAAVAQDVGLPLEDVPSPAD